MDEYEWYDDDEPYVREPYVIIERREPGIGSFLVGAALGAGLALLLEERIEATLDAVDDKKRRVSSAFHAGRAAAREARGELEQRIAESKAAYKS